MKKSIYTFLILLIIIAISCNKDDKETEDILVCNFNVIPIGESQVTIDWEEIPSAEKVRFTIDKDRNFTDPLITVEVSSKNNTATLDGLEAVTDYFIQIEVESSGQTLWNEIKNFTSLYTAKIVNYPSTDNVEICAILNYISSKLSSSSRTAIFLHEFSKSKSSWGVTNIKDTLIKEGYICIEIDFRGHGCSTYLGELSGIIEMPWELREDFDATLDYLEIIELERSDEIVVFGASIGACVAIAVSSYENVIGGVAASAVEYISKNMGTTSFTPKGIYYLAGELDENTSLGINYKNDAILLYNATIEPSKYNIIDGTAAHGVELLANDTELINKAIDWVRNL